MLDDISAMSVADRYRSVKLPSVTAYNFKEHFCIVLSLWPKNSNRAIFSFKLSFGAVSGRLVLNYAGRTDPVFFFG